MEAVEEKAPQGLSIAGVAQVLASYAGKTAVWWLMPEHENDRQGSDRRKRRTQLVVEAEGEEMATWPLNTKTYGGLVRRLAQQPVQGFAIPHLPNHHYDDYPLLPVLKYQCQKLLNELEPEVNQLLKRIYALDDTAGVPVTAAEEWWRQAEKVQELSRWSALRDLQRTVGQPDYLKHSGQLQELLPQAQAGLRELRRFLADVPAPGPLHAAGPDDPRTPGDGSRHRFRHAVSAEINRSSTYFRSSYEETPNTPFPDASAPESAAEPAAPDPISRDELKAQLRALRRQVDELIAQL